MLIAYKKMGILSSKPEDEASKLLNWYGKEGWDCFQVTLRGGRDRCWLKRVQKR